MTAEIVQGGHGPSPLMGRSIRVFVSALRHVPVEAAPHRRCVSVSRASQRLSASRAAQLSVNGVIGLARFGK